MCFYDSRETTEKTLNLRGLKCPLPALRTRKALSQAAPGDILVVECTDPLTSIDIPNLLNQTGDTLEDTRKDKKLLTFRILEEISLCRHGRACPGHLDSRCTAPRSSRCPHKVGHDAVIYSAATRWAAAPFAFTTTLIASSTRSLA